MRRTHILLAIGTLVLGLGAAFVMTATPKRAVVQEVAEERPLVEVIRVRLESVQLSVATHGTVVPSTATEVVPEVTGRVVWISPALVAGGSFDRDEPLLRIDEADYRIAHTQAQATLARAESEAKRARNERSRVRRLAKKNAASASKLEDAENGARVAEATLLSAQASLERAELDLERTEIRAPYSGRVRRESVNLGQFVARGQRIAELFATDHAEVRLPIRSDQLAALPASLLRPTRARSAARVEEGELPVPGSAPSAETGTPALPVRPVEAPDAAPRVLLTAEFAGAEHVWEGSLVRLEGEIDAETRVLYGVARIDDPLDRVGAAAAKADATPPLTPGLFVDARILGRRIDGAAVIPRAALHAGDRAWIVDSEGRLRETRLRIVQTDRNHVIATAGVEDGDLVSVTALSGVGERQRVQVMSELPNAGASAPVDSAPRMAGPVGAP